MTCFAADVDLRPGRVIAAGLVVEILLQIGGMAVGAHVVPALGDPCPMQVVVRGEFLVHVRRRQIEPLSPLGVPSDPQHLDARDLVLG
jgi:hypothetical protein